MDPFVIYQCECKKYPKITKIFKLHELYVEFCKIPCHNGYSQKIVNCIYF